MKSDNYISVQFKGGRYMVVSGSKRADALQRAHRAWVMGYDELANDLFDEAKNAEGCAFAHRERQESAYAEWSDTQAYYNLYN